MQSSFKVKAGDGHSTEESILDLLDQYAGFVAASGRKTFRAGREKALDIVRGMPAAKKVQTVARLTGDLALIREAMSAGESAGDSRRLLWRFLKKNSLVPCSDIFEEIGNGDVVEIYGTDQIHLWQNLDFFDWISVTLERIYCQTWYECTTRPPSPQENLVYCVSGVFKGEITATFAPNLPWYWIEEIDSELLYKFLYRTKAISPVMQNGQVAGLICVSTCKDLIAQRRDGNNSY